MSKFPLILSILLILSNFFACWLAANKRPGNPPGDLRPSILGGVVPVRKPAKMGGIAQLPILAERRFLQILLHSLFLRFGPNCWHVTCVSCRTEPFLPAQ